MSLLEPVFSLLLGHCKQLTAWLQTQTSEARLGTISLTIVILDFTVPGLILYSGGLCLREKVMVIMKLKKKWRLGTFVVYTLYRMITP